MRQPLPRGHDRGAPRCRMAKVCVKRQPAVKVPTRQTKTTPPESAKPVTQTANNAKTPPKPSPAKTELEDAPGNLLQTQELGREKDGPKTTGS